MIDGDAPASEVAPPPQSRADAAPREVTARGIVLGVVLAVILGAANAYLGLYAGLTVSASIPAAVISMAVLRALGGATILENNVVQTIASAGEAMAAGAIFTFPALIILGRSGGLPYGEVTMLCVVGGTLGSLLVVFLRRTYIVEERLPYPEGFACAQVLRAGEAGGASVAPLVWGGVLSAILKTSQDIAGWIPGVIGGARWIGGAAFAGSADISAALPGIGYIIGIRIASLIFMGGVVAWLIAVPLITAMTPELGSLPATAAAARAWGEGARYLGVGAMLVGGVLTLWRMRGAIARALAESIRVARSEQSRSRRREDTDVSTRTILIAFGACIPVMFALYAAVTGNIAMSAALAIALAIVAFFAAAVAGYLTGLVGASNNPISGVTVIVLLAVALLLRSLGVAGEVGPRLAIMVGAVVCTAAAMAGDSLHDLATGYHLGATPRSLEMAVLLGAIAASFVVAPIMNLLISGYGIAGTPTARAGALAAPQAFLMAKVAQGVFAGGLPWRIIGAGGLLALALGALDSYLGSSGSKWRTPVMPVAIGLYLPLGLSVVIFIGALIRSLIGAAESRDEDPGVLFAAGLIAGEAVMGVFSGALVTAGVRLPLF